MAVRCHPGGRSAVWFINSVCWMRHSPFAGGTRIFKQFLLPWLSAGPRRLPVGKREPVCETRKGAC